MLYENFSSFRFFIQEVLEDTKCLLLSQTDHEEAIYSLTLKFCGRIISEPRLNLLKFALSLRAFSPAVQMQNKVFYTSLSLVVLDF